MDTYNKLLIGIIVFVVFLATIKIIKLEFNARKKQRSFKQFIGNNMSDSSFLREVVKEKHKEKVINLSFKDFGKTINGIIYIIAGSVIGGITFFIVLFFGGIALGLFGIIFSLGGLLFDCWQIFNSLNYMLVIGIIAGVLIGGLKGWDRFKENT